MFPQKQLDDDILRIDTELDCKLAILTDFTKKVEGDTDLHREIRKFTYPYGFNKIKYLFAKLGKDEFSKQAKTVNAEGDLPIDLIEQYSKETQKILFKCLLPYCLVNSIKPVSDVIDEKEVLKNIDMIDSKTVQRLKIACNAANQTRKFMSVSITHPDINHFSKSDFYFFYAKYNGIRTKFNELKFLLWCSKDSQAAEERLLILVKHVEKNHGLGNCEYFCYVGIYFLKKLNINVSIEIFFIPQLKNGRHWFLVVGRIKILIIEIFILGIKTLLYVTFGQEKFIWHPSLI